MPIRKKHNNKKKDPKGYYEILGVTPESSFLEIKNAFRQKVKYYHPDHNPLPNAREKFQKLSSAYDVLSDGLKKSIYDIEEISHEISGDETKIACDYYICQECNIISKQPRFVRFKQVFGKIIGYKKTNIENIYCPKCASKVALKINIKNWIFGWWGIFLAPYYNLKAIIYNFKGGEFLRKENIEVLLTQSLAFLSADKKGYAKKLAYDSLEFVEDEVKKEKIKEYINNIGEEKAINFENEWNKTNKYKSIQVIPFFLILICGSFLSFYYFYGSSNNDNLIYSLSKKISSYDNITKTIKAEEQDNVFVLPFDVDEKKYIFHTIKKTKTWHSTKPDSDIYKIAPKGETVKIHGVMPNKNWVQIMFHDGTKAFVKKEYIKRGLGSLKIPPDSKIIDK